MADTFKKFFETDVTFSQLQAQGEVTLASTNASTTAVLKQVVTSGGNAQMGTPKLMLDNVPVADLNVGGQVSGNQIVPESTTIKIKGGSDMGNAGSTSLRFFAKNYNTGHAEGITINGETFVSTRDIYSSDFSNPNIYAYQSHPASEAYYINESNNIICIDRSNSSNLYVYVRNLSGGSAGSLVDPVFGGNPSTTHSADAVYDGDRSVYYVVKSSIRKFDVIDFTVTTLYEHSSDFSNGTSHTLRVTLSQGFGQPSYLVTHYNRALIGSDSYIHVFNLNTNTLETASINSGQGILDHPTSGLAAYFFNGFDGSRADSFTLSSGNILFHNRTLNDANYNSNRHTAYIEIDTSNFNVNYITAQLFSFNGSPTSSMPNFANTNGIVGGYTLFRNSENESYAFFVTEYVNNNYGNITIAPFNESTKTIDFTQFKSISNTNSFIPNIQSSSYGGFNLLVAVKSVDNTANPLKVAGYGIEST